jgi:hypothetical protein
MDRAYIQANDVIRRYLSGTLTEDESRAFESACSSDPTLADELNSDWQLKAGIEELESKDELAPLLYHSRRFFETPAFALAASLLAVAGISSALVLYFQLQTVRVQIDVLDARLNAIDAPKVLVQTFRVSPTRSDRLHLEIPTQGWIGLLVEASEFGGRQVSVELQGAEGSRLLHETALVSEDGILMLTIDAGDLQTGLYDITLQEKQADHGLERRIGLRIHKINPEAAGSDN